jgi:hypothetical protein
MPQRLSLPLFLLTLNLALNLNPPLPSLSSTLLAAEPAVQKPVSKIIPGQVIVPTDNMRRPWGELVSIDLKTRTGTFRNESTDQIQSFTVMPYAELLHHATLGDLQDYRIGERAIFRLHPNEAGEWVWLTYIQDEMNFLNNHKEYYWVDRIDAEKGQLECSDANADKSFVREKGLILQTASDTRYWKNGAAASFADIKVGDALRTKTHGVGKGKARVCWEVFLDQASLDKFQAEQQEVHRQRIATEGLPSYVDAREGNTVRITLFPEGRELIPKVKAGAKIRLAPTGSDRKPTAEPATGTVQEIVVKDRYSRLTLAMDKAADEQLKPASVARLWLESKP